MALTPEEKQIAEKMISDWNKKMERRKEVEKMVENGTCPLTPERYTTYAPYVRLGKLYSSTFAFLGLACYYGNFFNSIPVLVFYVMAGIVMDWYTFIDKTKNRFIKKY